VVSVSWNRAIRDGKESNVLRFVDVRALNTLIVLCSSMQTDLFGRSGR
jgi:hypothetical protein